MNEQMRAEFEEWAKDKAHLDSFEVDGDKHYAALSANIMWEAWQAAHARYAQAAQPKVPEGHVPVPIKTIREAMSCVYSLNAKLYDELQAILTQATKESNK